MQARFNYRNMSADLPWSYIWYFDGQELTRATESWPAERGAQGTYMITGAGDFLPGADASFSSHTQAKI